ncbi:MULTISPECIES: TraY domain-containing protein [unclassified Providencia]|uniref:TraY domain-containing protein n=1 Tax=unclassified Providencia TaxID=2633465 RepID=UPI0012B583DE|nr:MULTISPECIES: TraY domain-containing protein [unclassified Providencia]MTC21285.1 TraY domain-containing protein [Providencia sp. wls1938]
MLNDNLNHKRITIVISDKSIELLVAAARKSGRSKKEELKIRVIHSLKNIEVINESYWDLVSQ